MHTGNRVADADQGDRLRRGVHSRSGGQTHLRPQHKLYLQSARVATAAAEGEGPGAHVEDGMLHVVGGIDVVLFSLVLKIPRFIGWGR